MACIGMALLAWASCVETAQEISALDVAVDEFHLPATLSSCGIATVFEQLSHQTTALAGMERGADCFDATTFPHLDPKAPTYDLSGLVVRDVLDRMMLVAPGYSWREVNGRAVVRPTVTWNDPQDVFNYEVPAFHVKNASNRSVLTSLLRISTPGGSNQPPFTLDFAGGTIIDILNALVASRPFPVWYAGLVRHGADDTDPLVTLSIITPHGGGGAVTMWGPLSAMIGAK